MALSLWTITSATKEAHIVLVELGLVEQRYRAVLEVLNDGATVTDVARRYGVGRQTVHTWLRRYASKGMAGLVDASCRPASCPHQMAPEVESRIVELRRTHPTWGPRTILHQLGRDGIDPLPGRSSVYRALIRHQLLDPKRRRRRRSDYKRWERSRAMELWQMDITGGVHLADGSQASVVTGIDDHSRFCVSAAVVARATARPVCDALAAAMRLHGVPDAILSDNGKVFTARFGPSNGEVLFDRICRQNGIRHLLTAPHSPTTTGKVERFHKTLKAEFLAERVFETMAEAQAGIDGWVAHYNHERPHQSLGDRPPIERFALARREGVEVEMSAPSEAIETAELIATRTTRRVGAGGKVSLLGFAYHAGRWLAGETVELHSRDGLIEIVHDGVVIASHATRHPPERDGEFRRQLKARPARPATTGVAVTRKVDKSGGVSFAAVNYRVGNAYRRRQVRCQSSATPCRSPSRAGSSRPTPSATTGPRSTAPSPTPLVDRGGSMPPRTLARLSRRNRSQLVARVPGSHIPEGPPIRPAFDVPSTDTPTLP